MKVDFHAHLPESIDVPADELLKTIPAGTQIFVCATQAADIGRLRDLRLLARERNIGLQIAYGLHPWFVKDDFKSQIQIIRQALIEDPEAQVGEIGLDKCRENFEAQVEAFTLQLSLAGTLNRQATVHCVRAWNEILQILNKPQHRATALHFHRFSGNAQIAKKLLSRDGNVIFSFLEKDLKNPSRKLQEVLNLVPAQKIFPESDSPLAPASKSAGGKS
ncbi:MAG: TatD family hydrolase [Opitutales bacterium]|nr:TatD family hydrolase [Opitutales bacterium]